MRLYVEMGHCRGDEGKMRSLGRAIIQCDLVSLEDQDRCRGMTI